MALGSIFVRFGADISDLERGISRGERLLRKFESSVSSIAAGLATITAPVAALGVAAVRSSSRLDLIRIGFEGILGSAEKAGEAMDFLRRLSARTPFSVAELGESLRTLVALNLTLEEATTLLPIMADTLSAIGRTGPDAFFRLAKAITDVQAKGKLAGPEVRQFAELGIPIRDILAKALGRSAAEIERMQEAGIPAAIVLRALTEALQARFGGAAERSLQAMGNDIRNLRNEIDLLLADFGKELQPTIKEFLEILRDDVLPVVRDLIEGFGELSPETKRWTVQVVLLSSALVPVLFVLGKLSGLLRGFAPLASAAAKVFSVLGVSGNAAAANVGALVVGIPLLANELRKAAEANAELSRIGRGVSLPEAIGKTTAERLSDARIRSARDELRLGAPPIPELSEAELLDRASRVIRGAITPGGQQGIMGPPSPFEGIPELADEIVDSVRQIPPSFELVTSKLDGLDSTIETARKGAALFAATWEGAVPGLEAAEAEIAAIKSRLSEIIAVAPEAFNDDRIQEWIDRMRLAGEEVKRLSEEVKEQNRVAQFEAQKTEFFYELLAVSITTGFTAIAAAAAQVASGAEDLGSAVIGALQSIVNALIGVIAQIIVVTVLEIVRHGAAQGGFLGALVAVGLAAIAVSAALAAARAQSSRARSEAKSFAEGGIISEPMLAVVGDAPAGRGPEVVSPLEDLRDMLGLGAGALHLNVYVGEEKLAERIIRMIPRELRRQGIRI